MGPWLAPWETGDSRRQDPGKEGLRLLPSSQQVSPPPPQNIEFPKDKVQARMGREQCTKETLRALQSRSYTTKHMNKQ